MDDPELQAIEFIKSSKNELCKHFASLTIYPTILKPSSYFMAGSPGAGKTEYSKYFIKLLTQKHPERKIVRIDADEIRDYIPFYNRKNAFQMQRAASLGVEKLLDFVLKKGQDFVLDGTFAFEKSLSNIKRCLDKKRDVSIQYLYQDPILAWEFTKKREALDGRRVPKKMFISAFFDAKNNVNQAKKIFGKRIELDLIIKNFEQGVEKSHFNIDNVDGYLKMMYTSDSLNKQLTENNV
jgi:predicted ABC-type ATPase